MIDRFVRRIKIETGVLIMLSVFQVLILSIIIFIALGGWQALVIVALMFLALLTVANVFYRLGVIYTLSFRE